MRFTARTALLRERKTFSAALEMTNKEQSLQLHIIKSGPSGLTIRQHAYNFSRLMRTRKFPLSPPARRSFARAGLALAFASHGARSRWAAKPARAQQKPQKSSAKKIETPQKYILEAGRTAKSKRAQIALKPSAPRIAQAPAQAPAQTPVQAPVAPAKTVEPAPETLGNPAVPVPITPPLIPQTSDSAPATGTPSGDDGAPITPPPAPVTAPQTFRRPPRRRAICRSKTRRRSPTRNIENPNAVLPRRASGGL